MGLVGELERGSPEREMESCEWARRSSAWLARRDLLPRDGEGVERVCEGESSRELEMARERYGERVREMSEGGGARLQVSERERQDRDGRGE